MGVHLGRKAGIFELLALLTRTRCVFSCFFAYLYDTHTFFLLFNLIFVGAPWDRTYFLFLVSFSCSEHFSQSLSATLRRETDTWNAFNTRFKTGA